MLRVILVNAPLRSAVCDHGVGHQMPLGLLMVGGPLLDAGFAVTLLDAARRHLSDRAIVERVAAWGADVVMIAHVGSTQAHPCCVRVLRAVKAALPHVVTVYGGVFPTYHKEVLAHHPEVGAGGGTAAGGVAGGVAAGGRGPVGGRGGRVAPRRRGRHELVAAGPRGPRRPPRRLGADR
jgi:anaerobic magnesium-protoporphyrin IX monomethyl ester cyclase